MSVSTVSSPCTVTCSNACWGSQGPRTDTAMPHPAGSGAGGQQPQPDPVQTLLQQMQDKFQTMSDQIIGRIDDMSCRIDDLEKNIADLMTQAGVEELEGENKTPATNKS
ncbi:PREDICTED: heat shock factor-binding protein 1 [Pygoscelis adeliae]|uniref:heat shock factor-binding protein 1 n=1 Tax=Pygoscelis adeliae TaxID=9238 RepID=UPI0004F4EC0A|nr:PREDICTED: heat shock factor-binding protein 1 [Pygoscelis adeliae]